MWARVKDWTVYYDTAGEAEPVLLLHGIPTAAYLWRRQMEALAPHFRVYAPDLLGWARSDKPDDFDYSIGAYAEFVNDFLGALGIAGPVALVVHDLGAAIGLEFQGRYPGKVSRLAVLDTFAYLPPSKRLPWVVLYRYLARAPLVGGALMRGLYDITIRRTDLSMRIAFHDPQRMSRELVDTYREFNRETGRTDTRVLVRNGIDGITGAVERNAKRVLVPTLILWAENDLLFPASAAFRLHNDIPGSVLRVIPDCGHFLQEEKPDEVSAALVAFLTDAWPTSVPATRAEASDADVHGRVVPRALGLLIAAGGVRLALRARGVPRRALGLAALAGGLWFWRRAAARLETVTATVRLQATPDEVWSYMSDLPFTAALPGYSLTIVGRPVGVGTVYRSAFALPLGLGFQFEEVVTEWVEPERIAYRTTAGWDMEFWAALVPEADATRLTVTLRYRAAGVWALVPPRLVRLGCEYALGDLARRIGGTAGGLASVSAASDADDVRSGVNRPSCSSCSPPTTAAS